MDSHGFLRPAPVLVLAQELPRRLPLAISYHLPALQTCVQILLFISHFALNGGGENKSPFLFWDGGPKTGKYTHSPDLLFPKRRYSWEFCGWRAAVTFPISLQEVLLLFCLHFVPLAPSSAQSPRNLGGIPDPSLFLFSVLMSTNHQTQ